jgi:hypothetical protein
MTPVDPTVLIFSKAVKLARGVGSGGDTYLKKKKRGVAIPERCGDT